MRDRLVHEILGAKLDAGATKLRGQALELRVAQHLGCTPRPEELLAGGYPDIRNQALEVKVQDAATIDLGKYSPQFKTGVPQCSGLSTEDIRYLIALTDATTGIVKGTVLTPGVNLGRHFTYITGESYKCQRSIPMSFFDEYDGQAVFNP